MRYNQENYYPIRSFYGRMPKDLKFFRLRKAFLSTNLLIFKREVLSSTYSHIYIYIYISYVCVAQRKSDLMHVTQQHTHVFTFSFI